MLKGAKGIECTVDVAGQGMLLFSRANLPMPSTMDRLLELYQAIGWGLAAGIGLNMPLRSTVDVVALVRNLPVYPCPHSDPSQLPEGTLLQRHASVFQWQRYQTLTLKVNR